ncbi:MAG TPA: lysine-2,3-aminomutase-like protein [Hyphomicrobiaceae bacterium]|nr:lysine-2,3-aminomutase-like protein [Hyphomicrobiaceae bacterium]
MPGTTATLRSLEELEAAGLLPAGAAHTLAAVADRYAVAVTPEMAGLIDRGNPDDPIARQFLPSHSELAPLPGELADPFDEARLSPVPGVVHRYGDRALLKLTHVCPVYCRFCFRREVVGPGGPPPLAADALDRAMAYIAGAPEIWEVILTGGDPFMLSPRRLADVSQRLGGIANVKVLRWHTRVPAVDPTRVSPELVAALAVPGKAVMVVLHANHACELTAAARAACARLIDAGIPLLSQTVLLKGVNDTPDTLADLLRALVETRIKPYYLHQLDAAPGTSHFRVPIPQGQALLRALRGRLSGLAQPTYVLDIPGGHGKVPIGPNYLSADATGIADPHGVEHRLGDRG